MARTRDIRPNQVDVACDICGRTLLRGEHAESFLAGGARKQVCELCTTRAQHEGWIRESGGDDLAMHRSSRDGRRGSWRDRPRNRRERARRGPAHRDVAAEAPWGGEAADEPPPPPAPPEPAPSPPPPPP